MPQTLSGKAALLLSLFWSFVRIGPAAFGGGYATIPLIEREALNKRWVTQEEMNDLLSLASSAPGGTAVNASAVIGYRLAGIPGAVTAVAGITLPTFIIAFALSLLYSVFRDVHKVQAALQGIQGAVIALMIWAAVRMAKSALFDATTIAIASVTVALLVFTSVNPVAIVAVGLFAGIVLIRLKRLLGLRSDTEKKLQASVREEIHYPEYYI
ncbi:chromate transporter [Paenibacillus thailandensis]|uniref:Chromate transporter n=1 Tax=Paenibacillus thailandensis TaxID=393250 RepID=A0ABW5R380_9BACL